MPYSVKKHADCPRNKPWAVVKTDSGAKIGCHASRTSARRQQRALYANENKDQQLSGLRPAPAEVQEVAKRLIQTTFPNLAHLRIVLAVRDTVLPTEGGGFAVAATGVNHDPDVPFDCLFWFAWDVWQILTETEKEAIVFHEFMHCNHDRIGDHEMREHDASVFNAEIERYGAWWKRPMAQYNGREPVPYGDTSMEQKVNWNSVNWNSVNWNSEEFRRQVIDALTRPVNWNSVNWNSVNWNSVNWNSVNWNSVNWNSVNWNSMGFRRFIIGAVTHAVNWNSDQWNPVNWNSVNWNSVNWNSVNWNSEEFQRSVAALLTNFVNWNSVNWNSVNWNSVNWNSVNWNSVNWNSVNWNSVNWNDAAFQNVIAQAVANAVNWNSVNWNSMEQNPVNWNSVNWNSVNWNSVNWNSLEQNLVNWNSMESDEDMYREPARWKSIDEEGDDLKMEITDILTDDNVVDKEAAIVSLINEYRDDDDSPPKRKGILGLFDLMKKANEPQDLYALKAPIKRENGLDFPARDYAYVPDPLRPATWQLRLTESPGKVTLPFLTRAAASISPTGFRGVKAKIPPTVASAVKRRILAEYRKLGVQESEIPASVKSLPDDPNRRPLYIWKDQATGIYNFIAIYSNNLRDDDMPAEILSEKSHQAFAEALELGLFDYPELWHWHIRGSRWGKANHMMVIDGFPVALGTIDKGHEAEAEALMNMPSDYPIAMSHGMPRKYIVRNKADPTIIEFYVSEEISTLPRYAAANKYTGFMVLDDPSNKEITMPLTAQQRDFLKRMNLPDDAINGLDGVGEVGKASGRESKELPPPNDASKASTEYVTKSDFLEAVSAVAAPLVKAIEAQNALIVEQGTAIADLQAALGEYKAGVKAEVNEMTPRASLADLARGNIFGTASSAKLDDNDPLQGKKPEEAPEQKSGGETGIEFLDDLIKRSHGVGG